MKSIYLGLPIFFSLCIASAQEIKETIEPLSKKAQKGYICDVSKDESGNCNVTFKMKMDKKSDVISFEKYSFDSNLKFTGTSDAQEKKEKKDDFEQTSFYAYVGGGNSFDVLSMKLKINKVVRLKSWDQKKQVYTIKKTISEETIKPKNDNGKVYYGHASYSSDKKSDLFAIAKTEAKNKKEADQFLILKINESLELKETPIDLKGSHSLVYSGQLPNENVVMVFAPNKGAADVSKYVYYQFGIEGNLKDKVEFKSPASALLITSMYEKNGDIYFFGTSTKSKDEFEEVFNEYAPIYNPGYSEGGNNKLDAKWRKSLDENMENFHLLKFKGDQLVFASKTPVSEFKSKFKTAPSDKGASVYKGKNFFIEDFYVTNTEDYLITGQLKSSVNLGIGNPADSYEDIVCFHFDKNGNLKAQYGIGKVNNDKKSEIFKMVQNFHPSADGKSLYWEILEVKGTKGYESFMDAYYNSESFYPLYFPRIVKIDLANSTLGPIKSLGSGKYFLKRDFPSIMDSKEKSITYFGLDEDWEKLWIGKVLLQ